MAKADLRKAENDAAWLEIGQAMDRVRCARRLSVKEFAEKVGRDEAQVRRWFGGTERPQVDAVFAVKEFRQPMVIELAHDAGAEVTTQIAIKQTA